LGHGLPVATAVAAGTEEPSLWIVGVLGLDFLHRMQGAQFSGTAASLREPSLSTTGVPGPDFSHRLQGVQFSDTAAGGTKPDGLHILLLVEQQEPLVLLTQGHQFPWCFRVNAAGHVVRGNMMFQVLVCAGKQDLQLSTE
jgi:hypothetical protein